MTVAYDSLEPLESLARDLMRQSHAPQHWLVVDNAPRSAPLDLSPAPRAAGAIRVEGREGAGFGAGCNQAFDQLCLNPWQGWVWLLNPDTSLASSDLLARFAHTLAGLSAKTVVGTAVVDDQENVEPSGGWIEAGLAFRRRRIGRHHLSPVLRPTAHTPPARFDPAFPLYYEDIDLCLRLGQGGAPVLWSSNVRVAHQRGRGSGGTSARRQRLSTISYWRFLQRYSPGRVRALRGARPLLYSLLRLPSHPANSCAALAGSLEAWREPVR